MTKTLAILAGLIGCFGSPAYANGFVGAQGTQFILDGKPFYVKGVNNHYLTYGSQVEVTRVLDDAVAMGANVIRTFLQPVIGSPDNTRRTIWAHNSSADSSNLGTHGTVLLSWNSDRQEMDINLGPNGIQKVDFLLAEAAKRNLKIIVVFLDYWSYTGGALQMMAWYGGTDAKRFFFVDPHTRANYRTWVRFVVDRVNPLTNKRYRDDPVIFAWELMNEPQIKPETTRNEWVSSMSAYIKSLDQNHMVASGQDRLDIADYSIPTIDFVTWHGYPLYYQMNVSQFDRLIDSNCNDAARYQKPVLLEEFGFSALNSAPTQAEAYAQWLTTLRSNKNCAGWVVWRLVSRQDGGEIPSDSYDHFDIVRDQGPTWNVVADAAHNTER
jgi:mannan endo-1,4-beta-mannosidase